ncbi:GNAT family N-acetyltransferase [Streptomyces sp. G-G2]|uniref:GNAT family N-acetyltransferase n=1 Tax=Streptomyces sp. G-G2 TaxID=3046201 RepID=UPI0024B97EC9|nr:GNAT family N-acetyltransferase [Streptomyces sp. G-G2]MDJ0383009.1 GNAT family N-acetyltransferase [Streptomyces sp. G-G2]
MTPPDDVLAYDEAALPEHLAAQVAALEEHAWPGSRPGHDPALAPRVMLLLDGEGAVAAALALLHKEIRHAGRTYRAAGLSAVVTREDARGRGHGGRLVAAARAALADVPGLDLALFSCDRDLAPFYEAAGFQRLPGAVLVGGTPEEPLATDAPGFDKVVLAAFFGDRGTGRGTGPGTGPRPAPGTPRADPAAAFAGTRIGLYPGTVDRLW